MKAIKLFISHPQLPISILLMLALLFIAIAKIAANDNSYSSIINKSILKSEMSNEDDVEVVNIRSQRRIMLYPIYN
jgi:hypothetical protein